MAIINLCLTKLSKKDADIFRSQNRLIQDNRAPGDLERAIDPPQDILPCADKNIFIFFHPRPINDEVGMDFDFPAVVFLVRMFEIRWRVREGGISAHAVFA